MKIHIFSIFHDPEFYPSIINLSLRTLWTLKNFRFFYVNVNTRFLRKIFHQIYESGGVKEQNYTKQESLFSVFGCNLQKFLSLYHLNFSLVLYYCITVLLYFCIIYYCITLSVVEFFLKLFLGFGSIQICHKMHNYHLVTLFMELWFSKARNQKLITTVKNRGI